MGGKPIFVLLVTIILLTITAFDGGHVLAQDQYETAMKINKDLAKADGEMTRIYSQIIKEYAHDKEFIEKMKTAQRAWIRFRDAHLEALYPAKDKQSEYGSSYPSCYAMGILQLTRERIDHLMLWKEGVDEGNVCAGSVKFKQ